MNKAINLTRIVEELLQLPSYEQLGSQHDQLSYEAEDHLPSDYKKHNSAVEHYNSDSDGINKPLRQGRRSRIERVNEHTENLAFLTKQPTQQTFHSYRGSTGIDYDHLKKGDLIHDKGFTSTSLSPVTANTFGYDHHEGNMNNPRLFRIHVKPGTKGHYISAHDSQLENTNEKEFLIHKGTHFKIGETHTINIDNKVHPITDLHIHSQED